MYYQVGCALEALPFRGHPRVDADRFLGSASGDGLDICATGTAPEEHAPLAANGLPARVGRRRARTFLDLGLNNSPRGPIVHATRVTGEEANAQLDDDLRGQSVNDDDEKCQSNGQCNNVM